MPSHFTVPTLSYLLLLAFLFFIVIWKLIQRRALAPLFWPKRNVPGFIALAATLLVAVIYLVLVIHNPGTLPPVPKGLLTVLAVANAIYLANKARTIFTSQFPKSPINGRLP